METLCYRPLFASGIALELVDEGLDVIIELIVQPFGFLFLFGLERADRFADVAAVESGEFEPLLDCRDADRAGDRVVLTGLIPEVLEGQADVPEFAGALPVAIGERVEQFKPDLRSEVADACGEALHALGPKRDSVGFREAVDPDDIVVAGPNGCPEFDRVLQRVFDPDDALDAGEADEVVDGRIEAVGLQTIGQEFISALPALVIPVFIIGGILSGMFTATEAGAVAVLYAIGLGFYQGSLTGEILLEEFRDGMVETFSILFIISLAMLYGLVALQLRIPILLADAITGFTTNPTVAILIFVPLFMLIGTFMSITATIMIMVPILMPIIGTLGIDPIHFGIVMILSLMTGVVTPPLGSVLFVLEKVTDASLETVMRAMVLFYIPLLVVILIVALVPEVSVYVPNNYFF